MSVFRMTEEEYAKRQRKVRTTMPKVPSLVAPKPNKYHAKRDGTFASRLEGKRARELMALAAAGAITDLEFQPKYELIPAQRDAAGKVIERAVTYTADSRYMMNGQLVVEDVKGVRTQQFIIRRKLLLWRYGIQVTEVK